MASLVIEMVSANGSTNERRKEKTKEIGTIEVLE